MERNKKYRARLGHKFWWDSECSKEKRKTKRAYKKWRKGKINKADYMKTKMKVRELCKDKEKAKKMKEIEKRYEVT